MVYYNGKVYASRRVYFTGKTINAVNGSRTNLGAGVFPPIGGVLVRDRYGFDQGVDVDFTQPQTNFLHEQKVIVASLLAPIPGTVGRWVEVIELDSGAPALVKANATDGVTFLGVVNGSFNLESIVAGANGGLRVDSLANLGADIQTVIRAGVGLAMETADTSGAAALKQVRGLNCRIPF